jgi:hypothetical protein
MTLEREERHVSISARDEATGRTLRLELTLPAAENLCAALRSLRKTAPKDAEVFDFGTHCRIDFGAPGRKIEVA